MCSGRVAPPPQAGGVGQPPSGHQADPLPGEVSGLKNKRKICLLALARSSGVGAGFVRVLSRFIHPSAFPQAQAWWYPAGDIWPRCCNHVLPTTTTGITHRYHTPPLYTHILHLHLAWPTGIAIWSDRLCQLRSRPRWGSRSSGWQPKCGLLVVGRDCKKKKKSSFSLH